MIIASELLQLTTWKWFILQGGHCEHLSAVGLSKGSHQCKVGIQALKAASAFLSRLTSLRRLGIALQILQSLWLRMQSLGSGYFQRYAYFVSSHSQFANRGLVALWSASWSKAKVSCRTLMRSLSVAFLSGAEGECASPKAYTGNIGMSCHSW